MFNTVSMKCMLEKEKNTLIMNPICAVGIPFIEMILH